MSRDDSKKVVRKISVPRAGRASSRQNSARAEELKPAIAAAEPVDNFMAKIEDARQKAYYFGDSFERDIQQIRQRPSGDFKNKIEKMIQYKKLSVLSLQKILISLTNTVVDSDRNILNKDLDLIAFTKEEFDEIDGVYGDLRKKFAQVILDISKKDGPLSNGNKILSESDELELNQIISINRKLIKNLIEKIPKISQESQLKIDQIKDLEWIIDYKTLDIAEIPLEELDSGVAQKADSVKAKTATREKRQRSTDPEEDSARGRESSRSLSSIQEVDSPKALSLTQEAQKSESPSAKPERRRTELDRLKAGEESTWGNKSITKAILWRGREKKDSQPHK